MSKPSQRRQPTSQHPARPKPGGSANRRTPGMVGLARGRKPSLSILAMVLALAALVLVPAVVLAHTPSAPKGLTATSGDGTMVLSWGIESLARAGYEYQYSSAPTCLTFDVGCVESETTWAQATDASSKTDYTIPAGTLTVGKTYYFQVRAKDNDGHVSAPSDTVSATQRAAPAKLANVQATAGNAEVTLSWDAPLRAI